MEKIYLSDSGPKVSPAIYGFYRWTEDDCVSGKMESVLNLCLETGINTFDHGDIYGNYYAEEYFGKLLKQKSIKREDVVLFTKCGKVVPNAANPEIRIAHYNTSREHILQSLDNSLKKLGTDYVDIFLLNHLDHLSNLEETALTLQKIKDSGKVKYLGVVNFSVFQHQLLASFLKSPIVTNHIEFNLLQTNALENGQLDYIKQRYMRPLATAPLAEGRIATGTDDLAIRVRERLIHIADKYEADIESIAIAWIVKTGALPLIGTTNLQRIQNIINAFSIELDRQDWYELYQASSEKIV